MGHLASWQLSLLSIWQFRVLPACMLALDKQAGTRLLELLSGCLGWPCLCQLGNSSHCGVFPPCTYKIGSILQGDISIHTHIHTWLRSYILSGGGIESPSDTHTHTYFIDRFEHGCHNWHK